MEAQIDTGASRSTGFDVPEQGLHLRATGLDAEGRTLRGGALDTSMGPIVIEMVGDEVHGWNGDRERTPVATPADHVEEDVVHVPEQFVALTMDGTVLRGVLRTASGDVHVMDRDGVVTLGPDAA